MHATLLLELPAENEAEETVIEIIQSS